MKEVNMILWDLDGTLVNPQRRLYQLFVELTSCVLSYEEYWKLKRQGLTQQKMLDYVGFTEFSAREFRIRWLENVERPDLLKEDVLFEEVMDVLKCVKKQGIKMYIVTNRQSYDNLKSQLNALGILSMMDGVISTFQKCTKAEAVRDAGLDISKAFFVGDSLEDMHAAADLGIPGVLAARPDFENGESMTSADYYIRDLKGLGGIIG